MDLSWKSLRNNNRWRTIKEWEEKRQKKLEEEGGDRAVALHCIIHLQALCSKCLKFQNVMSVIVKYIDYIRSRGLQHSQFHAFLEEIDAAYGDVLYFTEVRQLSWGNVLKRFFELRRELKTFMEQGRMNLPELHDSSWLMDLAFLDDITQELNTLNLKLQDPGQLVTAAFERNYTIFQHADPFSFDVQYAPSVLQMELIDLQCNSELKAKSEFREANGKTVKLGTFLRDLPPSFPELSEMFKWTICLFGSTYLCEKLFSTMKFSKSKYRSRLSDVPLQAILRVSSATSLSANVAQLSDKNEARMTECTYFMLRYSAQLEFFPPKQLVFFNAAFYWPPTDQTGHSSAHRALPGYAPL
ncbi:general transcription factor II-I repeat domain-containing protein 2B-like [Micropterus dolomieu]|uniref:general transcription factor II-I repeat domain-containing protein 2B-like n=1 Tax=Micropterus dolomieu TaxID=147949 RepID=UPI001E8E0A69|nr:general transcription factor II-I repeat domain-containing protein 2B-like [Micropterus dolomieu]XP_045930759.1 general transcription factor II-I repeat domain-containing protein 2B-like [Micropterus dolomieu]